jgi:quercetin dioxygenase-like cupin family protein
MMLRLLVLTAVLSLPLVPPVAVPVRAQEANPPAQGATMERPVDPPEAPAGPSVRRLALGPGEPIRLHPHPVQEIVFVVAGSATLRTAEGPAMRGLRGTDEAGTTPVLAGPGTELTVAAGDAVIVPPGNVHEGRAGDEGVIVMLFEFPSQAAEGTPGA